jgi:hypothetical protein
MTTAGSKLRYTDHREHGMRRPYFQAGTKELEDLFEQHKDEVEQLVILLDELEHRSTPKAITLKDRIVKRLAAKKAKVDAPNIAPVPRPPGPRQPELPFETAKAAAVGATTDPPVNSNGAVEGPDHGAAPKCETSKIRKPGRLTDVPDVRPSFTSNKIDLNCRRTLHSSKDICDP